MTGNKMPSEWQHNEMKQHLEVLASHLTSIAYEWIAMERFMAEQGIAFPNDESTDRVIRIFNNCMEGLESLSWLTRGQGTRDIPVMRYFSDAVTDEMSNIYHEVANLLKARSAT